MSGLGEPAFLERLGGLADVLAALLDLLAGLGHPLLVLLVLHPLAELVGVAEDLLLLLAEPLELALDLLAGLRGLGGLEGRLQLLEPFVQVVLPLGQLAEPVEDLAVLAPARARAGSALPASAAVRCSSYRFSSLDSSSCWSCRCEALPAAATPAALPGAARMTWNSRARSLSRAW